MSDQTGPAAGRHPQWWSNHLSREYRQYIEYEAEASRISVYHALFVPGLLQTADYARAISASVIRASPEDEGVTARVEARLGRQHVLLNRANGAHPATLFAAVDAAVLMRPVGGLEVMRRQLDHLLAAARTPTTEIVIVPLELNGHPGLGGTFDLLEFPNRGYPDLVLIESATTDFVITDPAAVRAHQETVAVLRELGHGGAAAIRDIEAARASFGS